MTASTLPYGSYVSPIGDLVPWNRLARSSRLGTVQEREAAGAVAMDTSDEERGHEGGRVVSPAKGGARKELWGAEKKLGSTKKRVEGTKRERAAARADEGSAAVAPAREQTSVPDELDGFLLPHSGVAEVESFVPVERDRQPRVGKRQLMQQLSVDQERLKAFLGEGGASGDLLQRIPHANLKEIERLKKEIERTEAMLRRKLEEDSDSDSSSSSGDEEDWAARDRSVGGSAKEHGGVELSVPARGQSAAKLLDRKGESCKVNSDRKVEGNAERKGQETTGKGREGKSRQGDVQSPASKKEKRRQLIKALAELEEVKKRQAQESSKEKPKPAVEGAGEEGRTEKRRKDMDTSISMEAGKEDDLGAGDKGSKQGQISRAMDHPEKLGVREGKGSAEEQSKKKKKKKLAGLGGTAPDNHHERVSEKGRSQDEEGERQRLPVKTLKKKLKHLERVDSANERRPTSGMEDKSGKARLAIESNGTDGAHKSRAVMAAAREALPEADQKRLRAAAANAKLVQQAQMSGDVVELGPRVDLGEDEYVGCDKCEKWRFLPYWLHTKQFKDISWTCDDVDWLE